MAGAGPNGADLGTVLRFCAKLDEHHLTLAGIPAIDCDGDWILRDGASTEAILTDLHNILLAHYRLDMQYEKDEVVKDALIVSGKYHRHRLPDATSDNLQIFSDVMDHPKPGESSAGGGTYSPPEFWTELGFVGMPFVDESTNEPTHLNVNFSYSNENAATNPARRQMILDNITKQTELVFKQEKRTFTTWKLTAVPGKEAPFIRPDGALPPMSLPEIANNTPDYEDTMRRMRKLMHASFSYVQSHQHQLPPDLGAVSPALKDGDAPNCFLTPADQLQTKIPATMSADWVRQHTSFVYLAANVDLQKLTSANADLGSVILLHTKLDEPFIAPRMGKVIAAYTMHGDDLIPLADAPAAIAKSLKILDGARAPVAASTQP
jgi:hypothetical protein